jgi:hypothetical protein
VRGLHLPVRTPGCKSGDVELGYPVAVEDGGLAITAHGLLDLKQEIPIQIQSSAHTVVAVDSKALGVELVLVLGQALRL